MSGDIDMAKKMITDRFDANSEEAGRLLEGVAQYQRVPVETLAAELVAEARQHRSRL